ncbi:MAG: hypothetical protein UT05_C0001G0086 [Parcubacteria group bacterium GW2011_GWF2_38_76]|nr:MAG: hypothetical protein UT05_C0001G0086 [Parcubacteria group bacterium GW2011_GWF2_38_76]
MLKVEYKWPYRLTVRTAPSQGVNQGSIPCKVINTKNQSESFGFFVVFIDLTGNRKPEAGPIL